LPDPDRLARRLGEIGVGPQTQVVVYDDAQGMIAGRLWWLLRWLGHEQVAVLDGGLQAWNASPGALTQQVPSPRPAQFCRQSLRFAVSMPITCRLSSRLRACIWLTRVARIAIAARTKPLIRSAGHIPGAVNRFFGDNLQADGRFKPAANCVCRMAGRSLPGRCRSRLSTSAVQVFRLATICWRWRLPVCPVRGSMPVRGANGALIVNGR
jgi:thiosulfate/3-mercaptopyruvate sulfurtransferase